jgi:hypothetical protein
VCERGRTSSEHARNLKGSITKMDLAFFNLIRRQGRVCSVLITGKGTELVDTTDVYRQAIKRTFASLYGDTDCYLLHVACARDKPITNALAQRLRVPACIEAYRHWPRGNE